MSKMVGMRVYKPRVGAPEFVKGRVGINVAQFGQWMMQNADDRGWVNLDLLLSKEGDLYMKHNEFKPMERLSEPQIQNVDHGKFSTQTKTDQPLDDKIPF
jgi:hypothetical protein